MLTDRQRETHHKHNADRQTDRQTDSVFHPITIFFFTITQPRPSTLSRGYLRLLSVHPHSHSYHHPYSYSYSYSYSHSYFLYPCRPGMVPGSTMRECSIHTVLTMPNNSDQIFVCLKSSQAYLTTTSGQVIRTFSSGMKEVDCISSI